MGRRKKKMKLVNFVIGEMGGVGKSFFCKTLIEYYQNKKQDRPLEIFDVDNSKFDVGHIYVPHLYQEIIEEIEKEDTKEKTNISGGETTRGTKQEENTTKNIGQNRRSIYFTEERKRKNAVDAVVNQVLQNDCDIIVNTPANVHSLLINWIKNSNLLTLIESSKVKFVFWFVSSGHPDSLASFKTFVESIPQANTACHVFVKNLGILDEDQWNDLLTIISPETNTFITEQKVKTLEFQECDWKAAHYLEAHRISLTQMVSDDCKADILNKGRARVFLNRNYEEFNDIFPIFY